MWKYKSEAVKCDGEIYSMVQVKKTKNKLNRWMEINSETK